MSTQITRQSEKNIYIDFLHVGIMTPLIVLLTQDDRVEQINGPWNHPYQDAQVVLLTSHNMDQIMAELNTYITNVKSQLQ